MKKATFTAVFIGSDGTQGFVKGQPYTQELTLWKGTYKVHGAPHGDHLLHEDIFDFLANWKDITMTELVAEPERELTFGEMAVGINFNPGGMTEVNKIKRQCADYIDYLNDIKPGVIAQGKGEVVRMLSVAITEVQGSQMWGVKAVTWQY